LYTTTCENYVCPFERSIVGTSLQGGPYGHGHDRNSFQLKRAHMLKDVAKLMIVVANYASRFSFTT